MHPDVHYARVSLRLADPVGDVAAAPGMLYPEIPDALVRIGQGQVAALRM